MALLVLNSDRFALHTPPLADSLTANDLIRMTLDRYLAGAKGYGQAGYAPGASGADIIGWKTPVPSLRKSDIAALL